MDWVLEIPQSRPLSCRMQDWASGAHPPHGPPCQPDSSSIPASPASQLQVSLINQPILSSHHSGSWLRQPSICSLSGLWSLE